MTRKVRNLQDRLAEMTGLRDELIEILDIIELWARHDNSEIESREKAMGDIQRLAKRKTFKKEEDVDG